VKCYDITINQLRYNKAAKGVGSMPQIIPIRDLKNTSEISQMCHASSESIL
jgi:hypothetical protein